MRWILVMLACNVFSVEANAQRPNAASAAIERANEAARQNPAAAGFEDATYIYEYAPGALYQLHANPNFVSTILLEPGESLIDKAAGDTARWLLDESEAGQETSARTIVMIKPTVVGLVTNIVLITDRRTYMIEARSNAGRLYQAQIAWRYPLEIAEPAHAAADSTRPAALNFSYRVRLERGPRPTWFPERVYDDGERTWIDFPARSSDLPPLFLITGEGVELVNYRVSGVRYEIDRVFQRAELRFGRSAPIIVRIERTDRDEAPRRTRRGRP